MLRLTPPPFPARPSGDARADVGVVLLVLLGIKLGLGCARRGISSFIGGISSCGGPALPFDTLLGSGGACIMDILFRRRASVGLIVRAPKPDARPETVDWRLLPDEDGVLARLGFPFETGRELGVFGSGSRGGGCRLFTLFARDCVVAVTVDKRGSSAPADVDGCIVVRLEDLVRLFVRASEDFSVESGALGNGCDAFLPSIMDAITPGPRDFLGARLPAPTGGGAGPAGGGPCGAVLWRLLRSDKPL